MKNSPSISYQKPRFVDKAGKRSCRKCIGLLYRIKHVSKQRRLRARLEKLGTFRRKGEHHRLFLKKQRERQAIADVLDTADYGKLIRKKGAVLRLATRQTIRGVERGDVPEVIISAHEFPLRLWMIEILLNACHHKCEGKEVEIMQMSLEEKTHIERFDDLDYNVFSGQKWQELDQSHDRDIIVHWPDGHTVRGIDKHIEDLKAMFVYAPDTRIQQHPIKIASGEWTAVMGIMEGTFTEPMITNDGKTIHPTGKAFKLPMVTIGHWKNGVMDEEWLFWDNMAYMRQIGLA